MKKNLSFHIIKTEKNEQLLSPLCRLAVLPAGGLILAGLCIFLLQIGQIKGKIPILAVMLLISLAVTALLSEVDISSFRVRLGLGAFLALFLLLSFLFRGALLKAASLWMNGLQDWLYLQDGIYRSPFTDAGQLLPAAIWAAVSLGFLTGWLLRLHAWPLQVFLLLAVFVSAGSGKMQALPAALMILGLMLAVAEAWMDMKAAMVQAFPVLLVLALLLSAAVMAGASLDASLGSHLGDSISQAFHRLRYENTSMAMPEGELDGLKAFQPSDKEALEVSMEHWQALYLKGFTGGDYTGKAWKGLSGEETEEEKELLYTLQKDYFFADTQSGAVYDVLADDEAENTENTVTLKNTGACRQYLYLPYGMSSKQTISLEADQLTREGKGKKTAKAEADDSVSFTVEDPQNSYVLQRRLAQAVADDSEESEKLKAYNQAEAAYRNFVYEHYMTVPEELQNLFKEEDLLPDTDQALSTTDAKSWINGILSEYLTYDESTVTGKIHSDFLEELVKVGKQGYCVHYASLAVMMLRSMGIPARYAEGYLVTSSQAEILKDGASLPLSQYNAHAWVEYYLDGIGWLVYDPTPGFTDELNYELPVSDESDSDDSGYAALKLGEQLENEKEQIAVKTEESDTESSGNQHTLSTVGTVVLSFVITLLILLLAAIILRTVILRRRLRKHLAMADSSDPKAGCAIWLTYTMELLHLGGMPPQIRMLSEYKEVLLACIKDEAQVDQMVHLAEKLWFSSCEITKEEREEAKTCSRLAEDFWKRSLSLPRILLHRFWLCKVL